MNLYKRSLFASIAFSIAIVAACGDEHQNEVFLSEEVVNGHSLVEPEILYNYQFIGNDANGYIQVPDDFESFPAAATLYDDHFIYAAPDRSTILTFNLYSEASNLKAGTEKLIKLLQLDESDVEVTPVNINGLNGNQLYINYKNSGLQYYTYLLEGTHELRQITIELYGGNTELRETIISSYSEKKYGNAKPTMTIAEETKAKETSLTIASTIEFNDNSDWEAAVLSPELDLSEVAQNFVSFKIRGDFNEGDVFFVSIEEMKNVDYFGNCDAVVQKDAEGTYIAGMIDSETNFNRDILYHFSMTNMSNMESAQPAYAYFTIQ